VAANSRVGAIHFGSQPLEMANELVRGGWALKFRRSGCLDWARYFRALPKRLARRFSLKPAVICGGS
jgi:hypothetical protein